MTEAEANEAAASLLKKSTIVYGLMIAVGLTVARFSKPSGLNILAWEPEQTGRYLATAGLVAFILSVLGRLFEDWFPSFKQLKTVVAGLLGCCSVLGAFYLAAISSLGEELLFRGTVQPFLGLPLTSALFGLMHMGPGRLISAWSLWAALAGLLLGWTFSATGNLWPAIGAHFLVNLVSLLGLRRIYLRDKRLKNANAPAERD